MLFRYEKDMVDRIMRMFANTASGDELVKQTARFVSSQLTTWKRGSVYSYSREIWKNQYQDIEEDSYKFKIDGRVENWSCVLWYDGPQLYEDFSETRILVCGEYLSTLETLTMVYCSNQRYGEIVDDHVANRTDKDVHAMDIITEKYGIKTKEVYMKYI